MLITGQIGYIGNDHFYLIVKNPTEETKKFAHYGQLTRIEFPKKPYKGTQIEYGNIGDLIEFTCEPIKKSNGMATLTKVIQLYPPKPLNG